MRPIKFRAKEFVNGDWLYGGVFFVEDRAYLVDLWDKENKTYPQWTLVKSETVGQFTGLTDKNGKEIWEGDILRFDYGEQNDGAKKDRIMGLVHWSNPGWYLRFGYGGHELKIRGNGEICWCDRGHLSTPDTYWRIDNLEIIGNIYENPELLEGAR